MDSNAALRRMLEALVDGDRDEAMEAADDLASWLQNGGAFPELVRGNCWIGSANREIWRIGGQAQ